MAARRQRSPRPPRRDTHRATSRVNPYRPVSVLTPQRPPTASRARSRQSEHLRARPSSPRGSLLRVQVSATRPRAVPRRAERRPSPSAASTSALAPVRHRPKAVRRARARQPPLVDVAHATLGRESARYGRAKTRPTRSRCSLRRPNRRTLSRPRLRHRHARAPPPQSRMTVLRP